MTHDHRTMISGPMPCKCWILRIAEHGAFLANREKAATRRELGERALAEGKTVVLDFEGVEAVTNGYADELVAKLREAHGERVRWENTNPEVADAIRTAISRRATPTPRS